VVPTQLALLLHVYIHKTKYHSNIFSLYSSVCYLPLLQVLLVLAGTELIFLSVAAVFWIWNQKNVDDADVFSCCYDIKDFFQSPMFCG